MAYTIERKKRKYKDDEYILKYTVPGDNLTPFSSISLFASITISIICSPYMKIVS